MRRYVSEISKDSSKDLVVNSIQYLLIGEQFGVF